MSHTTTINAIEIKDVRAMEKAVADLQAKGVNCNLIKDAVPRMYYNNQVSKCDYVLKLNDSKYDVGFQKQKDGTFVPVLDEWGNHISDQIGGQCSIPTTREEKALWAIGSFSQSYAKHAAIHAAEQQGYMVESANTDADGNVNLVLTGM